MLDATKAALEEAKASNTKLRKRIAAAEARVHDRDQLEARVASLIAQQAAVSEAAVHTSRKATAQATSVLKAEVEVAAAAHRGAQEVLEATRRRHREESAKQAVMVKVRAHPCSCCAWQGQWRTAVRWLRPHTSLRPHLRAYGQAGEFKLAEAHAQLESSASVLAAKEEQWAWERAELKKLLEEASTKAAEAREQVLQRERVRSCGCGRLAPVPPPHLHSPPS